MHEAGLRAAGLVGEIGDTVVWDEPGQSPSRRSSTGSLARLPAAGRTEHTIAEAYGVWREKSKYGRKYMGILRLSFLVDEKGKLEEVWYKVSPETRPKKGSPGRDGARTLPAPADLLPHRPPFLFVDEIVALEPVFGHGRWRLSGDEWFFAGHFPGRPTLPGVLMFEAIAQVGAIAVLTDERFAGKLPLFGGLDSGPLPPPGRPGRHARARGRMAGCRRGPARAGAGRLGDQVACELRPDVRPRRRLTSRAGGAPPRNTGHAPDTRMGQGGARTREPLWPPKPKLFDIVGPGVQGRASRMTRSMSARGLRAGGGRDERCSNDSSRRPPRAPRRRRARDR